jgi:hypothetical protein
MQGVQAEVDKEDLIVQMFQEFLEQPTRAVVEVETDLQPHRQVVAVAELL